MVGDEIPGYRSQGHVMQSDVPVPGQLVEVRHRHYVVSDVRKSSLPERHLSDGVNIPQHLVSLLSVEDDVEGEELQVIWEIEPGARAYERMMLPEPSGFDPPQRLDAFLDAVRWGAVSSADFRALQSPFRSGIEIEDYQLEPLVRALQMPRVNLLIADDVGLGKTVETGLVLQELIIRHRVRSVLIVCPASIQVQWSNQMRDKFGLEFRIVDSLLMKELRRRRGLHVNPWTHFPRLITSIDFLKRDRPLRLFRETLPSEGEPKFPRRFDLLVVDESHNVAPSGIGRYATDSLRTVAIRTLAPHFEHKLFLTATPHNGYAESFASLLELLDSQRFARGMKKIDQKQLAAVMVRRMKRELPPRWDGKPRFPERKIEALVVGYTDSERNAHQSLRNYTALRSQGVQDDTEKFATDFVLKLLKKRLFSSPAAFQITLDKHEQSISEARRRKREIRSPSAGILRRQVNGIEDDYEDDEAYEDRSGEAVDMASRVFRPLTGDEAQLLQKLKEFSHQSSRRADAKAKALIKWLHSTIKPGGKWGEERVLIFTEYRATQKWLQGLLSSEGLGEKDRLMTLYGGMRQEDTERTKAAFQAHPNESSVRILLATDCASEGIDLQNHCSKLIHYEIPWNPNRMEQRNGRLDRHGQRAPEVSVYHFVGAGYQAQSNNESVPVGDLEGDLEFLMRAVRKVETIREDLGKVGPVIADQVEQAMLGRRRKLETLKAEEDAKPIRQMLNFEHKLREQIAKLHQQLEETKNTLRLSPDNIHSVVKIGLELAGQPPLIAAEVNGIRPDSSGAKKTLSFFHLPPLTGSWAVCSDGLAHPHTGKIRPITFDHDVVQGRDDVVLAHLNHRLVQLCLGLLRAEMWSQEERKSLNRVSARLLGRGALNVPAVIAHARLVVLGGDNRRIHEEIIAAGGMLKEGRFARMNVGEINEALRLARRDDAPEWIKDRFTELWPKHAEPLLRSLEARMEDRTNGMKKLLEDRCNREAGDITTILKELERSILEELKDKGPEQLQLLLEGWAETERDQLRLDVSALERRVKRIPGEIEQETAAIRARYANPTPRLFPVAVTYLVPENLARQG